MSWERASVPTAAKDKERDGGITIISALLTRDPRSHAPGEVRVRRESPLVTCIKIIT